MTPDDNPFFSASDLPYQLPPFGRIRDEHFMPAFERGMAEQLDEVAAIVADAEPPSFANTVVRLEQSGQLLTRVARVFFNLHSSDATPEIEAIDREISPRYAAHHDAINLNPGLYARLRAIDPQSERLDAESTRLLEDYLRNFRRAGAGLDDEDKATLRQLNSELASLTSEFAQLLLADTNEAAVIVDDVADLAGLPEDAISAAANAAEERGHAGRFLLSLVLPTEQPALASLENPNIRRALFEAAVTRGAQANQNDTRAVISRITALRARRAHLLGYPTHSDYQIEDQTAKTTDAVGSMLGDLVPAALQNAKRELAELAEFAGVEEVAPADVQFYSDKVRQQKFDVEAVRYRPYFELERVLHDGVFYAANRLYGLTFTERHDLPVYHPQVRVFEVRDADGGELGLFLGDYFTRETKRGGAWMSNFVDQSHLLGSKPVVVNNLNISLPAPGEPVLLTLDEVTTLFHEFGHTLHGLLSDVTYPRFSGTSVPRDFVEYPSQVNEMWMLWPEVVENYARHFQTGEPLPQQLIDNLLASRIWGEGYATTSYLGAAILDLVWHALEAGEVIDDPLAFESQALAASGLDLPAVPPRYRTSYFNHIFAGGYSAGYYSYIWSEVLDADTVDWFKANGGLTRENGEYFRKTLLSRGGSVDPLEAFRTFRGRDPEIGPLLLRRGLGGNACERG
ncbi:M3 family metallopeptidase [Saxibacter everestensis]|uniref:M3 family metallopeptidase n=1 Tax=Saxibacter everestensis TaxID=2909229 RepID=A0ABY8QQ45_9MICO|nr:M3 family metallopeptidase [Brevibacteriaceae bacterium ZFBP1038]